MPHFNELEKGTCQILETGLRPIHSVIESGRLENAAKQNVIDCMNLLLDNGVDFNSKTLIGGNTILHIVALQKNNELIELLCKKT